MGADDETVGRVTPSLTLHHIGYAVKDIKDYIERFLKPVFRPRSISDVVEDPIQQVRVAFVDLGGTTVELVEPTGEGSPVQQILMRKRGGLYHLCYSTPNIEGSLREFEVRGCRILVQPMPAAAFGERRIAFVMTTEGDVIELLEMDNP